MNKIGIKTYHLDEFPSNAKITNNQGDQIKRFQLAYDDFDQIYSKLIHEINNVYNINLNHGVKPFRTFWKDEEDELVEMTSDNDVKTALQFGSQSGIIKVYIVEKFSAPSEEEMPVEKEFLDGKNETKKGQTHFGVKCDECKNRILGLRYKCKKCFDFNLCEDCKIKKKSHQSHPFFKIESIYGYLTCVDCEREMFTSYWVCKECNEDNMLNVNAVCNVCKLQNHNDHMCVNVSLTDLNRKRQLLLDNMEKEVSQDKERKIHFGINCSACKRDGVGFKSSSFRCENIYLCDDCFV